MLIHTLFVIYVFSCEIELGFIYNFRPRSLVSTKKQCMHSEYYIYLQDLYLSFEYFYPGKNPWDKIILVNAVSVRLQQLHIPYSVSLTLYSRKTIKHQIDKMAKDFPAANISVEVIGRTIEYNDIVMMKVTEKKSEISAYFRADDSKYVDEVSAKKVIFIVHGLSVMGMENIPCLVSNPQFKTLLSFYFSYLDKFDIFLIPMANPDGFVMSKRNYIWNKNMSPQGACSGVALDRNFDVSWNTTTTTQKYQYIKESSSSCSQHFPGLAPFSEPETKAIREVFHHYSHKMSAYLHVHSGSYDFGSFKGDAVLYPKGYTEVQSDDDKYIDLRGEIEEAMKNASFQIISVAVETLHTWYGQISGSSVDYASTVYGVPYAMELVMQPFQDIPDASQSYSENALNEIWRRVLDVIFNNIWIIVNTWCDPKVPLHLFVTTCITTLLLQVGCEEDGFLEDKYEEDSKYDDYTLIKLYPKDEYQVSVATHFFDPENKVEVLKTSRGVNDSLDVLVPPDRVAVLEHYAQSNNLRFEVKETEYGRRFEPLDRVPKRRVLRAFNVYDFNSFAAIQEYLETAARRHPQLLTLQNLGTSYQGRRMKLAKISSDPSAGNPIIFIDAGIHAREWVAPAMALYLIHRLTNDPDAIHNELKGVDWYILPVVNPDGYEFTRSNKSNRLWRKTRSKSKSSDCFGVDGNRNYGFKWAVSGVSNNPCDKETYAGPKPFSEPETLMVRSIMMENAKRLKLYVSLHSYGQYLVYPWGYTGEFLPKQWKKLDSLARSVSDAIQRAGGKPFKVMSAGKWYAAAGGSDDYAFGAVGVPYSYTMELTSGHEFIFPRALLPTVLPQFYEGFKAFGAGIRKEFRPIVNRIKAAVPTSSSESSTEED
ncbi:hypothetical protein ABMA28_006305 [Loxostege sticticalis]|uniref:Peptidase M14 domain-containing protein n=1 Tax=Loxostege sticticalis TaxID=481309 RepID=A0ABD0SLH5_LOXSC